MRKFEADKCSGIAATVYHGSPILEVVRRCIPPVFFPFYALTWADTDGHKTDEWVDDAAYRAETEEIVKRTEREGFGFFTRVRSEVNDAVARFHASSAELIPKLSAMTDEELASAYERYMEEYNAAYAPSTMTFVYESHLSEELSTSLAARYENAADAATRALQSGYVSFMVGSARTLRAIKEAEGAQRKELMERYKRDFFFMSGNYEGGEVITDEWIERHTENLESPAEHPRESAPADIEPTPREAVLIGILKESEVIRDLRKRCNVTGCCVMTRFLEELVRRTGVARNIAERMFWTEFRALLMNRFALEAKLAQRKEASVVLCEGKPLYLEYLAITPRSHVAAGQSFVKGVPAARGKVAGPARIVLSPADFPKVQTGDILISEGTRPDYLPVMNKAAAFVTDEGGLTSHAAIVAREMKKPCVVGTKTATVVFKDGDFLEVDADTGTIRRIAP